MNRCIN